MNVEPDDREEANMKIVLIATVTAGLFLSGLVACATGPTLPIPPVSGQVTPVKKTMQAFRSDQELAKYFRELAEKQRPAPQPA